MYETLFPFTPQLKKKKGREGKLNVHKNELHKSANFGALV